MHRSIRPLEPEDADEVAALQSRLWRATYTGLVPDRVLRVRDDAANVRVWRKRARDHALRGRSDEGATTLVAHDRDGRPIGWASTGPPRDDDPPTATELWSLYVAEEHHGSGVAHELLEAALPSPAAAHLWVLRGNDRAIAFYRKRGFLPDGTSKHDDRLGADELRLVR